MIIHYVFLYYVCTKCVAIQPFLSPHTDVTLGCLMISTYTTSAHTTQHVFLTTSSVMDIRIVGITAMRSAVRACESYRYQALHSSSFTLLFNKQLCEITV